ncbi:MAG: bifunctional hydroxymethylpyrimidine kinase/phosphomethylpyrimidine kinase [Candidatus Anoxymicrobium japonicum]|uniref:Bifunctional hydroxymethylpyrimidine kinase/phosphomethylpyrimidine kinase n=1 Tax=Candidatus Anoxymicrobium japonicum TaxID=2013648 RepID=A0A2N3G4Z7_9ACTN|nr:MAG: bifunctional hydroxymethylpyrimidine kinase/phosphomethylpyrimidine kinase [Candidatus Anoxymicrobium japonicum]
MTTFSNEDSGDDPRKPQPGLRTALSVAGLDPSGGAGIVADVRTFDALGVYPMAVAATLTFQSTLGVKGRFDVPVGVVRGQLEELFADGIPNAIKTGALGSAAVVKAVGAFFEKEYSGPLVVDPVVVGGSGGCLLDEDGMDAIARHLLPRSSLVTPNALEAESLCGFAVSDVKDAWAAAMRLVAMGARSALITGLKIVEKGEALAADVFYDGEDIDVCVSNWIEGLKVHGTGCLLSAAITAHLAKGMALKDAVTEARSFTMAGIQRAVSPGKGVSCANPSINA